MTPPTINKEGKKKQSIEITEKVVFEFAHEYNAQAVAMALCWAGYFVRISRDEPITKVYVYKYL